MSILVCGGAGYIGAHVVRLLRQRGDRVVVVDDLSSGKASRVGDAKLVKLDVTLDEARSALSTLMVDEDVTAVSGWKVSRWARRLGGRRLRPVPAPPGTTSRTLAEWPTFSWRWRTPESTR